jgi:NADPH:quinone reductase-like Zn-dependent oxidoreductase
MESLQLAEFSSAYAGSPGASTDRTGLYKVPSLPFTPGQAAAGAIEAVGRLKLRIGLELPLRDAAESHRALEGRKATGKVLLLP